jgi:DNA-binding transcriptional LysR family regulator
MGRWERTRTVPEVDLQRLSYFVALAEELHFGRAAARLHLSQSGLSHAIAKLERQLDVPLVNRTSREVSLTAAGEALHELGLGLLDEATHIAERVRAVEGEEGRELVVGFSPATQHEAASALRRLTAAISVPAVFAAEVASSAELEHAVVTGSLDAAFLHLPLQKAEALQAEAVAREERLAAVTDHHPLATRPELTMADLLTYPIVVEPEAAAPAYRRWLRDVSRAQGYDLRISAEVRSLLEALTLVAASHGLCLVPGSVARRFTVPGVTFVAVADAPPVTTAIASRPDPPAAVRRLTATAVERHERWRWQR